VSACALILFPIGPDEEHGLLGNPPPFRSPWHAWVGVAAATCASSSLVRPVCGVLAECGVLASLPLPRAFTLP
jgi:hypothetical protein